MIKRRQINLCKLSLLVVNTTILMNLSSERQQALAATVVAVAASSRQPAIRLGDQHHHHHHHHHQQHQQLQSLNNRPQMQQQAKSGSDSNQMTAKLIAVNNIETNALAYLQRYGYMQAPPASGSNQLISEESFSSAISDFQRFAGLPQTGQVDNETLSLMKLPRCGNTDKPTTISKVGQLRSFALLGQTAADRTPLRRRRRKRYALQGSKWRRQELTYRISQYPTKFTGKRHEVDAQIEKAFGIWSQVAPIDFVVKREGRVHIDIRFASGDHGDGDAFDGPGNTLAHAYFPQYGGDAHFDDQEYWTIDSYAGTNIFQVAAHELGHSLGLGHSNVREALMAPFYQKYKPNFRLHIDDVLAIQALYGEKAFLPEVPGGSGQPSPSTTASTTSTPSTTTTTTTTTTSPTTTTTMRTSPPAAGSHPPIYKGPKRPPAFGGRDDEPEAGGSGPNGAADDPDLSTNSINGFGGRDDAGPSSTGSSYPADLCSDSTIDAVTRTEDGATYVFKGDYYWMLTNEGLAKGYPRRIATDWEGLPGQLDAALTWADGKTFFFKGNKYWRFRNRRRDLGYPKLISAGFAGVPDDIDAAFVWSGNGRTYFFKGAEYWRFDSKADPPVSSEYPRSVKVWLGVPAHVNAAFKWENNVTYFFKGNQYYRFNDREFKVETRGRPQFPRQTSEWWFGCVNSNLAQRAMPQAKQSRPSYIGERSALVRPTNEQGHRAQAPQTSGPDQSNDWSFLAGLSEDSTRSMGTHISDHHRPPQPPHRKEGSSSSTSGKTPPGSTLPEETLSQPEIEQRSATPSRPHYHEQYDSIDRRLAPPPEDHEESNMNMNDERRGFRLFSSNAGGPQYHSAASSSSSPSAILLSARPVGSLVISELILICTLFWWTTRVFDTRRVLPI